MKRLPFLAAPRLHTLFPPFSYLLLGSGFPTSRFPVLAILLMLVMSPLLSTVVLEPAQVSAQNVPGELDSKAIYDSSAGPVFSLPQWTDGSGWDAAEYYSTIQMADINNDHADELLARGYNGMTVHEWDATLGLWKELSTSGPFSNPGGWNHPEYYSTIQTADIDGDGSAELLGRGVSGMYTYKWDGTNWQILRADDPAWTDAGGWSAAKFYSTIQTADIDGEKGDELLARGVDGIDTYKWSGSEWTLLKSGNPSWSDSNGWGEAPYYSTIQTADIDGEPGDELLALGVAGMDTYKWGGSEWKLLKSADPGWEKGSGWDRPDGYTTIQTGDIDGDGQAELFARGMGSLSVFTWTGGRWKPLFDFIENQYFPDYQGWNHPGYYLTLQSADIDGEKGEELLIRHSTGMLAYKWNPTTKLLDRLVTDSPKLDDDHWSDADNYLTIQTGDIDGDSKADLIARGIYGIRTWSYNGVTPNAWDYPSPYGFKDFTGDEVTAYDYINTFLTIASGQTIRGQYSTDPTTLGRYQNCLNGGDNTSNWTDWKTLPTETCGGADESKLIPPPLPLRPTLADWNLVAEQIWGELGQAQLVSAFYNDLATLYIKIFVDNQSILTSTAQTLLGDDQGEKSVDALFQDLFLAPFALSSLGGDAAAAVGGLLSALIGAGLDASGDDSFSGTWSAAQDRFTELSQRNQDAIIAGSTFVAGDAGFLQYVAQQKGSGAWDPGDDWVRRSTTSEGLRQMTRWTYQTLTPVIWNINAIYSHFGCTKPDDEIYNYFVDDNAHQDCYRQIQVGIPAHAPTDQLHNILDPVSSECTATEQNTVTWAYGTCSVGVPKEDFFLNRNGWRFAVNHTCPGCSAPP